MILLLRLLFVWFVLRSVLRLVRGIAEGMRTPPQPKPPQAVPLVRDPVCGTYVVPSNALSAGTGAQMKFFCCENCRRVYVSRERNGASGDARASEVSLREAPEGTEAERRRRPPEKIAQ